METATSIVPGKFLDPQAIIAQIDLAPGSTVADFGCGPGYFSIPFAQHIGEMGKLYAFDILPQALETVEGKRKNLGIANIITQRANLEKQNGSKLETNSVDLVILKDILFQNKEKELIVDEAHRILKPGARALIVEWNQKSAGIGPEMEIRLKKDDLIKLLEDKNFVIKNEIAAGNFHYALVARKR